MTNMDMILIATLAVSECLALIPGLKSNGILDMILNILKGIAKKDPMA